LINETCVLLGYYAANRINSLPDVYGTTYRSYCQCSPRTDSNVRSSHLIRGGGKKKKISKTERLYSCEEWKYVKNREEILKLKNPTLYSWRQDQS